MGGGMMGSGMMWRRSDAPTANMPITAEQAVKIATEFLKPYLPGITIEEPDTF